MCDLGRFDTRCNRLQYFLVSRFMSVVMVPIHSSMNTNHGRQLAATESSVIVADHNYAASRSWDPA